MRAAASPLPRLAAWHRLGERRLAALRGLREPGVAQAVLRHFDASAAVHRAEQDELFPALLESMAGSDPVCLRQLAAAATHAHRAIEAAWHALRPEVLALAQGQPVVLAEDAVAVLARCCRDSFALEDREILPMVARLLDDDTLRGLAVRLGVHRGRAG
jgi:Hemerythrin HHE cation binding domain